MLRTKWDSKPSDRVLSKILSGAYTNAAEQMEKKGIWPPKDETRMGCIEGELVISKGDKELVWTPIRLLKQYHGDELHIQGIDLNMKDCARFQLDAHALRDALRASCQKHGFDV